MLFPTVVRADYTLNSTNTFVGAVGEEIPINDLQINGSGDEPIPVKLLVTNGTLEMSTTTGLTFDGSETGSTIYFSGTQTNINNALATLTYTRASAGDDTLEVSLVPRGEVFFPDNNHLYKFISGSIDGNGARTAALNQTAYGSDGYLATITSEAENDFVADRLVGDGWMGASDAASEGDWKWLDGPEAGESFWSGDENGSVLEGYYANWNAAEPNDYNNGVPGEDCAQFYATTGRWNDLPCSGSNIAGYVVEFGAPGDLPTVAAKNITVTTVTPPSVASFSPADNATGIALDANLVITFNRAISEGSSTVIIRKSSDDTVVETIPVSSDQISGYESAEITINPSANFLESTGYYVTIASTAFEDSNDIAYSGISTSSTWNFTTGDFTDPSISSISASSVDDDSAVIAWTTNEQSSSQVDYGLVSTYGSQTVETDTSPRVTSHSVTLSNLKACARYYYRVRSTDASSNDAVSSAGTFTTTGCGISSIEIGSEESIPTTGGTITFSHDNSTHTITVPNGFYGENSSFQINHLDRDNLPTPPSGTLLVDDNFLDLLAVSSSNDVISTFLSNVTFTTQYGSDTESSFEESSLDVYKYTGGTWVKQNCSLNMSSNTITCSLSGFSIYAVFGTEKSISGSNSSSSSNSDESSTKSCHTSKPTSIPDLFQIDVTASSAQIFFTPSLETNQYYISYSESDNAEGHGTLATLGSEGVQNFTVESLQPNTTYYFKVRSQKDCAPGDWSGVITTKTSSRIITQTEGSDQSTAQSTNAESEEDEDEQISAETSEQEQPYTVNVTVMTAHKPVPRAQVVLVSGEVLGETDDNGRISFPKIKAGNYKLRIVQQAHAAEQEITVAGDESEFDVVVNLDMGNSGKNNLYKYGAIILAVLNAFLLWRYVLSRKRR